MKKNKLKINQIPHTQERVSDLFCECVNELRRELQFKFKLDEPLSFHFITHLIARNKKIQLIKEDMLKELTFGKMEELSK